MATCRTSPFQDGDKILKCHESGLLVECGKKWKIVRKILPNSAGNSAEKSEIVRENAK